MKKLLIFIVIFLCFLPGSPSDTSSIAPQEIHLKPADPNPVDALDRLYHGVDSAKKLLNEKGS
jgi:hypothetical protein